MAAPNLRSPTLILGRTALADTTETPTAVLSNVADSGQVLKVNALRLAAGSALALVSVAVVRGGTSYYLQNTVQLAANTMLIVLNKDEYLYLEEGDSIEVWHEAGSAGASVLLNYEEIS